jgi:hypothetical protein
MKKRKVKSVANKKLDIKSYNTRNCGGCGYFLAFIGAAVYYIQNADSFWMGTLGVLKALVWPAILIYKLLGFLG